MFICLFNGLPLITHLTGKFLSSNFLGIPDWMCCRGTPLYLVCITNWHYLKGCFRPCDWLSLWCLVPWINHLPLYFGKLFWGRLLIRRGYFWLCICFFLRILIFIRAQVITFLIFSLGINFKSIEIMCTSIFLTFSNCQRNLHSMLDGIKCIILKPVLTYKENLINPSLLK